MGKIRVGILGSLSGKVGPVVGATWRGIPYVRSYVKNVRNPRTLLQRMQRAKMSLAISFLKPLLPYLQVGWRLDSKGRGLSPFNFAVSYTLRHAIAGEYPGYEIDFSRVLLSRGNLTAALNAAAIVIAGDTLVVTWSDNSGVGSAQSSDRSIVVAFNGEDGEAIGTVVGSPRAACSHSMSLPARWTGKKIAVFVGFISEDRNEVANSVFVSELTVV